jgi:iron complex outermembrane receptor protein
MGRRLRWQIGIPVFCVALTTAVISAQESSVVGHIIDQQGGAVAGATVTLDAPGQPTRTTRSGTDGAFTFNGVQPARYTLRANAPSFAQATEIVTVGTSGMTVTIALRVAGIVEDLTVRGAVAGIAATAKIRSPARDLPLTIESVPREIIVEQAANDLVTALQNTSSTFAFITYGVYEYYTFRGFSDSAQLLDGVRNEGPNRLNSQLTNVDRVDVLKGPSSALYGAGAVGATVNVVRKKPSTPPVYDFMGAFGSWETARAEFGGTGRLFSNAVLYRIDVGAESREGYRHDHPKRLNLSPSLAWRVGPSSHLNIYYTVNRDKFGGDAGLPLVDTNLDVPTDHNVIDVPHDRNYRTPFDEATQSDNNLQIVYGHQMTDSLGFRNVFSYRRVNEEYLLAEENDFIAPSTIDRYYLYFNHHRRPVANVAELTATMERGVEHELLVGWDSQRYHNYTTLPDEDFFQAASIDAFKPIETQQPFELDITRQNVTTSYGNGLYAQDHVTVGPRAKLLIGARYDINRRSTHSDDLTGPQPVEGPHAKREAGAFTGRVGLVYQPASFVDVYGSWANSFTPLTVAQPDGSSLDPQTASQWEIGQRSRHMNDRILFTTAGYRILRQKVAFRRPGGFYVQAGQIESRGFEADFEASMTSRWRVNMSYGFNDSKFLDYEESPGVNRRGNTTQFAPRNTVNVWTSYAFRNGFSVNGGARYFGEVFADSGNAFAVGGYGLLNFAIRYRRGSLEYALNLNNLTDTTYYVPHLDYLQVYPGAPVNVLGTVRVRLR